MTKKRQSRATKVVLASILAASLSMPTFASAASVSVSTKAETVLINSITAIDDGTYEVVPTMTAGMNSHFEEPATLIVKGGEMNVQLVIVEGSNKMVGSLQTERDGELVELDLVEGDATTATRTVSFPVVELGKAIKAHVVVNVPPNPSMPDGMVMPHDFEITVNAPAKEEVEVEVAEEMAITVYKDGTAEESIMKTYMAETVTVTEKAGTNVVTVTFPKGHYIQSFKVAGKAAILASEDKATKERTYTFEVADLTKLVNSEIHVIVDEAGIKYDSNHTVQFGFGDTKVEKPTPEEPSTTVNPFTDIEKDGNKDAILALFDKGIIKESTKFNPRNDITRAQFALMIARALELKSTESAGFKDVVNLTDKERVNAIDALAAAGIVQKNKNFNPNKTLTRQQGALMLYRALNHAAGKELNYGGTDLAYYADGKSVTDEEAQKAFALLYTGKIMTGSPQKDGKVLINANSSLQRTQMAKILNGSLDFINR